MIKKIYGTMDVVEAARQRIRNIFDTAPKVYLSVSGGKDSAVLNDIVFTMAEQGELDLSKLEVGFIDEEAIYPCVEETVKSMRQQWLSLGVPFVWWCIEVRHFNCLNSLSEDESFICWDSTKKGHWVREMPRFARTDDPKLRKRKDTYQDFLARRQADGCNLIGIRCAESVQRIMNVAASKQSGKQFPIYDWSDTDVWMYLRDHNVKFPTAYQFMYQVGRSKKEMRISQFFSVDTAGALVQMCEYYPGLFDRVCDREPNAYLAMLYYDTEMFRKKKERKGKDADDGEDYKAKVMELFDQPERFQSDAARENYKRMRQIALKYSPLMRKRNWKLMYNTLIGGDPKGRTYRALIVHILDGEAKESEKNERKKAKGEYGSARSVEERADC